MTLDELLDFSKCIHYLEGPHVYVEALEHMSHWNKFSEYLYNPNTDVDACKLYLAAEALQSNREYIVTKIIARIGKLSTLEFTEKPQTYATYEPFVATRYAVEKALKEFAKNPETEFINISKMYATELAKGTAMRYDVAGKLRTRLKRIAQGKLREIVKNMRQTLIKHKELKNENPENLPG